MKTRSLLFVLFAFIAIGCNSAKKTNPEAKDETITEKIETKYTIKLPEYSDFEHNKNLIDKTSWVNYK